MRPKKTESKRLIAQEELDDIKSACRVTFARKKVTKIAPHTRVSHSELSKYGMDSEERCIPVDIMIDVIRFTGEDTIFRQVAAILGYELMAMADPSPSAHRSGDADIMSATKEFGDIVSVWMAQKARGPMDAMACQAVRSEVHELIAVLLKFERGL